MNQSCRVEAGKTAHRSVPKDTGKPPSAQSSVTGTVYSHRDSHSDSGRRVAKGCSHRNQLPMNTKMLQAMREPQPIRQKAKEEDSVL